MTGLPSDSDSVAAPASAAWAEPDVLAAVLSGDGDAYAHIVARHQARVAATLWRFTRDPGRVEELVQDTFVEAYMSLRSFTRGRPFGPWLRKIAVRVGYRHWKSLARSKAEVSLEDIGDIPDSRDDPGPERAAEMVHELLAGLPPRDRLVLTLLYVEGCSVAEAAELTGWSRIMVKVQAHRARAKLKRVGASTVGRRSGGGRPGGGQSGGGAVE